MQSSFVISSLSHISIELSGTSMQDCLKRTSAHTCTHMYKDTKADIHAHVEPFANTWLENKNRIIYIFKGQREKNANKGVQ